MDNVPQAEKQKQPKTSINERKLVDDANFSTAARDDDDVSGDDHQNHPHGFKLFVIMFALCLAVFCVALDMTIVATAIPRISDTFHALQDIGWYGSAYLLTTCAFQLFYGKLYVLFNIKLVFLVALAIFEVGSLVCATAPNSTALIVGRAIAGVGAAGVLSGTFVIIAHSAPVVKRPIYTGISGMMYGLASVLGPLIGGAFTTHVTWRWCFYINLPLGGVTAAIIMLFLQLKKTETNCAPSGLLQTIWRLDPIGTMLFIPTVVCLLLALKWGGSTYDWSDGRIIALLVVFSFFLPVFVGVQIWLGESATIPPRIFRQRTVAFGSLFAFLLGAAFFMFTYFVPVWFQAIEGVSALTSGIHTIPLILTMTVAIVVSGGLTTKFGHYMPCVYASTVFTSMGSGLIYTWNSHTSIGKWVGYQIIFGLGCGLAFQLPQIAAQAVLPLDDVAIGVAITFFAQVFGGTVFVSIGNNLLDSRLIEYVGALNISSIDPAIIVSLGATQLRSYVPAQDFAPTVDAYNRALVKTFQLALIASCLTALGAAGMEWKSVKQPVSSSSSSSSNVESRKQEEEEGVVNVESDL